MNVGNTFLSISVILVLAFITGANTPAGTELTLRQVPEYKGSMMSLSSAMASLGSSINLAVMSYFLSKSGWGSGSIVVGGLGLIASMLTHLFVTETPNS
jgi:MFS family permease